MNAQREDDLMTPHRTITCWPDTTHDQPPTDHPYWSATWLLGRHPNLAEIIARIPGAVNAKGGELRLNLDLIGTAVETLDTVDAAWAEYVRVCPAPDYLESLRTEVVPADAHERWRADGPTWPTTAAGRAADEISLMSGGQRTRVRLLGFFSTVRAGLRVDDLHGLDASGQRLFADWTQAVIAVNATDTTATAHAAPRGYAKGVYEGSVYRPTTWTGKRSEGAQSLHWPKDPANPDGPSVCGHVILIWSTGSGPEYARKSERCARQGCRQLWDVFLAAKGVGVS